MADVAHTIPANVKLKDGSRFGFVRPGLQVTPFASGQFLTRDWYGYNVRQYEIDTTLFDSSGTVLEEWETFWHHIDGGATAGFVMEPISQTHRDLLCGVLGDASKTSFPVPAYNPSSVTILTDGVPEESSAYTLHTAANLMSSDTYALAHAGSVSVSNGTDATVYGLSIVGTYCAKVTPDTVGACLAFPPGAANGASVSVGDVYTAIIPVFEPKSSPRSFTPSIRWYSDVPTYLSSTSGSAVAATFGEWTIYSVEGTAPASSAYALPAIQEPGATTDPWYIGAWGVAPGDYDRWHLPAQCPGVVEFSSAPSDGARITATATGKRITRCRFEPGTSWSLTSPGHAAARSITATEWIEF
jgi:hypothetical protein